MKWLLDYLLNFIVFNSSISMTSSQPIAVAESFFQLLKRERIKRKTYSTREEARTDVFDYIEMFYNAKRRYSFNNQKSPVEYDKQYKMRLGSV